MKVNVQKIFQDLASYVDFPTIIFINKTGRIIARNRNAENIIGNESQNVKELFGENYKAWFRRGIIEQKKQVFYNVVVHRGVQELEVDIQVNVIPYENQHVTVCFFEQSYKAMYEKYMSLLVPRLFYKNSEGVFTVANHHFLLDNNIELISNFRNEDFMEEDVAKYILLTEENVLRTKQGEFNAIHTIRPKGKKDYFIRVSRIPVLDRDGEAMGILGIYTIILNRDEYKGLFDTTLRQMQILSRILSQQGKYVVSWKMEEGWPIEYVSSNFSQFGYAIHEVYSGVILWARIIHPMDYERIEHELKACMINSQQELPVLTYRIRKGNGRYIWIEDKTFSMVLEGNTYLREGMFYVLPEECYKDLEKKFERGVVNEVNS